MTGLVQYPRVALGTIHGDYITAWFVKSLLQTLVSPDPVKQQMFDGCSIRYHGGVNLDIARNAVTQTFLDDTGAHYLMFLDSDEVWVPDELVSFVLRADQVMRPITSGVVFTYKGEDKVLPVKPTGEDRWMTEEELDEHNLPFTVDTVPAGALLIRRDVFTKIGESGWWDREPGLSEDLSFCNRAREAGFDFWVDPRFRLGHMKLRMIE